MKPFALAIALLALAFGPSPSGAQSSAAAAADARFDCFFRGVARERRALAGGAAYNRLTGASSDSDPGTAELEAILDTAPACAAAGDWTVVQRDTAAQFVHYQLAREHMRQLYAAQGVDLSFIDALAASASAASPPSFDDLVARVRAQGVGDNRPDSAGDIVYIYI